MSLGATLAAELEQEAATTRRVLERLPDDKLGWKPHEKSFSLGDLAWHIALTPEQIADAAKPDVCEIDDFSQPPAPATGAEILERFSESSAKAGEYLRGLSDEAALADWKFVVKGVEVMSSPRIAFIRSILFNHSYHHRGQLTVYLRLLDIPVPSIYGPSADEDPFRGKL